MYGDNRSGMQCTEFDLLLADAIDGQLAADQLARFEQHKESCPGCAAMFADANAGFAWLNKLDQVEPPKRLVHNILAATIQVTEAEATAKAAEEARKPLWQRIGDALRPVFAPMITPRFAMSAAMAFFSISTAMSVSGVRVSDFRKIDLTPRSLTRTYYATEKRAIQYYDSLRLVYEIESRVRELRRAATTDPNDTSKPDQQQNDENRSKTKEREPDKRYQNYSRGDNELALAAEVDSSGLGKTARQRRFS